jgi:hypothetical protein
MNRHLPIVVFAVLPLAYAHAQPNPASNAAPMDSSPGPAVTGEPNSGAPAPTQCASLLRLAQTIPSLRNSPDYPYCILARSHPAVGGENESVSDAPASTPSAPPADNAGRSDATSSEQPPPN